MKTGEQYVEEKMKEKMNNNKLESEPKFDCIPFLLWSDFGGKKLNRVQIPCVG
jgi:hypothetical protein